MRSTNMNSPKRGKVLLILSIIAVVIVIRVTSTTTLGLAPVESFFRQLLFPAQTIASGSSNGVVSFFSGLVDYKNVKDENEKLKTKLGELEDFNSELLAYKVENETLRQLLKMKNQNLNLTTVEAEVIGRSIKDWYKTITINKGKSDGIEVNMPVINYSGLVGKVTNVTKSTAEITLLTDPKYGAVTVVTTETGYPGILIGEENGQGGLKIIQIPASANILEGYEIITSGLGDLGYKKIKIGKIKSIANSADGLMKEAVVEPYVDFNSLNVVSVIIKQQEPAAAVLQ